MTSRYNPDKEMKVVIKSNHHGHYWSATNRDDHKVACDAYKIMDSRQIFVSNPLRGKNQVALVSCHRGKYVQIKLDNNGRGIHARVEKIGTWEKFWMYPVNKDKNIYGIKCANDQFIRSSNKGWILSDRNDLGPMKNLKSFLIHTIKYENLFVFLF
eukprot:UN10585